MNFAALGRGRESLLKFLTCQIAVQVASNATSLIKEVSSLEGPSIRVKGMKFDILPLIFSRITIIKESGWKP